MEASLLLSLPFLKQQSCECFFLCLVRPNREFIAAQTRCTVALCYFFLTFKSMLWWCRLCLLVSNVSFFIPASRNLSKRVAAGYPLIFVFFHSNFFVFICSFRNFKIACFCRATCLMCFTEFDCAYLQRLVCVALMLCWCGFDEVEHHVRIKLSVLLKCKRCLLSPCHASSVNVALP